MKRIKITVAIIVAAVVIISLVVQHGANNQLKARQLELAEVRTELNGLRESNQSLLDRQRIDKEKQARIDAERLELAELREEADLLRPRVEELLADLEEDKTLEELDISTDNFFSTAEAEFREGDSLVIGGWEVAPGVRGFIYLTPRAVENGKKPVPVSIDTTVLGIPEDALEDLGLSGIADGAWESDFSKVVSGEKLSELVHFMALRRQYKQLGEPIRIYQPPQAITVMGVEAVMEPRNIVSEADEEIIVNGPFISVIPSWTTDGSVSLSVYAEWNREESISREILEERENALNNNKHLLDPQL